MKKTDDLPLTTKKDGAKEKKSEAAGTAPTRSKSENKKKKQDKQAETADGEDENLYAENALELSGMSFKERQAYKKKLRNKRLSSMEPKERRSYIIRYYKWHFIAAIAGVFLTGLLIHTVYVANLPTELIVAITNDGVNAVAEEYIPNIFRDYYHLDNKNIIQVFTDLTIDNAEDTAIRETTLTDYEKIIVYISSGKLDAIIGDEKALNYYKSTGDIAILDSCLDSDLYDSVAGHIVEATDESRYMNNGEPYAAAIDISGSDFVRNLNLSYDTVYLMVPNNRYTDNSGTIRLIRLIFNLPE